MQNKLKIGDLVFGIDNKSFPLPDSIYMSGWTVIESSTLTRKSTLSIIKIITLNSKLLKEMYSDDPQE